MRVLTSIDDLNYRELLPHFSRASAVTIVTYSMELRRNNALWEALRSIPASGRLTLIACIPDCAMNYFHMAEGDSAIRIGKYYAALDPKNFRCHAESFLSHHNHAKIIRCDGQGYVRSANFTMGSAKSFEAGCLTDRPEDVARMDAFIEQIRGRAIPYSKVGSSLHIQYLLQFAADIPWLMEQVRFSAYEEREIYKDVFESHFVLEGFDIPIRVLQSLQEAVTAWNAIEQKAEAHGPLSLGETAVAESGIGNTVERLLEAAQSIRSRDSLPPPLSEEKATQFFINDYLMDEDPTSNPDLLERVEKAIEQNRHERQVTAQGELAEFLRLLENTGTEIFTTLRG